MDLDKFFEETDFDSAVKRNDEKISEATQEARELESLPDNNECTGGGCTI